jgi:hypothetical protein
VTSEKWGGRKFGAACGLTILLTALVILSTLVFPVPVITGTQYVGLLGTIWTTYFAANAAIHYIEEKNSVPDEKESED